MEKAVLIADSGGTKTDWCLYDNLGNTHFFETDSYHPHLVNSEWIASKKDFWKDYTEKYELEVHFYGSGCVNQNNQSLLKKAFQFWGINQVFIQSDILGAAKACFGDEDGVIGILGTGSVLAIIKNNSIEKVLGGFGYILGDEGSGYYFGKIMLQRLLQNRFTSETVEEIHAILGDRDSIIQSVYSASGRKYISDLALLFSTSKIDEINQLHEENLRTFIGIYLSDLQSFKSVSFVGSYADYNQKLLADLLAKRGLKLGAVVKKPIIKLSEYHKKRPF